MAASNPPVVRVNGELKMVQADGPLTPESIVEALKAIVSEEDFFSFLHDKELDFSYGRPVWLGFGSMPPTSVEQ